MGQRSNCSHSGGRRKKRGHGMRQQRRATERLRTVRGGGQGLRATQWGSQEEVVKGRCEPWEGAALRKNTAEEQWWSQGARGLRPFLSTLLGHLHRNRQIGALPPNCLNQKLCKWHPDTVCLKLSSDDQGTARVKNHREKELRAYWVRHNRDV